MNEAVIYTPAEALGDLNMAQQLAFRVEEGSDLLSMLVRIVFYFQ